MPKLTNGLHEVEITNDTSDNYTELEDEIITQFGYGGVKVLNLLTDLLGLQILTEENTEYLFKELGYEDLPED